MSDETHDERAFTPTESRRLEERRIKAMEEIATQVGVIAQRLTEIQPTLVALLRSSGPASAEAMKLRNALASSFCFDTVRTAPANCTVCCNSFGSGPM